MSEQWRGPGWWFASDGKWYPPSDAGLDKVGHVTSQGAVEEDDVSSSNDSSEPNDDSSSSELVVDAADIEEPDLDLVQLEHFDLVEQERPIDLDQTDAVPAVVSASTSGSSDPDITVDGVEPNQTNRARRGDKFSVGPSSDQTESNPLLSRKFGAPTPEVTNSAPPAGSRSQVDEPVMTARASGQPELDTADPDRASSIAFGVAVVLAILSGILGALWLRAQSTNIDLQAQVAEISGEVDQADRADLENALSDAQLEIAELESRLTDMSALVLQLPAGRVTEVVVPFEPVFADEEGGRLVAIAQSGEYVIWGDGIESEITNSGSLGAAPTGLFAATARAWVATEANQVEVLPMLPDAQGQPTVDYGPLRFMAVDARGYWSYNEDLGQVVRLRTGDGGVTNEVSLPVPIVDLTLGAGSVWALGEDGLVYRINTADLTVQSFDGGADLISITAGPDALWTLSAADGSLRRIDPVSGAVLVTVPVGRDPIDATFAGSSVWVALRSGSSLIEVDTATSAVVSRTELSSEPAQLFQGDNGVYVTTVGEGGPLLRIDSLATTADLAAQAEQAAENAEDG